VTDGAAPRLRLGLDGSGLAQARIQDERLQAVLPAIGVDLAECRLGIEPGGGISHGDGLDCRSGAALSKQKSAGKCDHFGDLQARRDATP
jgi:hypothetical protein